MSRPRRLQYLKANNDLFVRQSQQGHDVLVIVVGVLGGGMDDQSPVAVDESGPGKAAIISELLRARKWNREDVLIVGDSAANEIDAGVRLGISTVQILRPGVIATDLAERHIHSLLELWIDTSTH